MAKNVQFKGGKELNKLLKTALKGGKKSVTVGFFESAKYQDGTQVAQVAVTQEFGARNAGRGNSVVIPERPFFRNANKTVQPKLIRVLKFNLDPTKMVINPHLADLLGQVYQDEVQASITDLRAPANSPVTVELKGSSNPLMDTETMRASVTYKVK